MNVKVINNAGGMGGGPRNTIDLNTYGVRRVCEAFAPIIQDGGRIVQVDFVEIAFTFPQPSMSGFVGFCIDVRREVQS